MNVYKYNWRIVPPVPNVQGKIVPHVPNVQGKIVPPCPKSQGKIVLSKGHRVPSYWYTPTHSFVSVDVFSSPVTKIIF